MSTLNKLPDGSPAPQYAVTARAYDAEEAVTEILTEWWNEGKQVCSIEESAEDYFYGLFDKCGFIIEKIVRLDRR